MSGTDREGALRAPDLDNHPTTVEPESAFRERPVADPRVPYGGSQEQPSPAEPAHGEEAADVAGDAVEGAVGTAAFARCGRLFTAEPVTGPSRELPVRGPVPPGSPGPAF
ncbi:hypothetical protein ABZ714_33450 [Streptomyces sp. NPDC006798]|uniref:hypothetical protein n=1 Tax=Streptomyces sp. NPDC006798 TaxID=3155462 RepID=UPI0033FC777C